MRASFHNPNFLCSFNSLTQCLYNLEDFRNLVLSYDVNANIPIMLADPTIDVGAAPSMVSSRINNLKSGIEFTKEYIKIFKSMNDPKQILDLRNCVANFEDANGKPFLRTGPCDPFLEFLAILRNFSLKDRPFMCQLVSPLMDPFTKLFTYVTSRNFRNPVHRLFMGVSSSPLFKFDIAGTYHDFRRTDNPPTLEILHSLPDILCVHVEDLERHNDETIQFTVDFNHFVFDNSKDYRYRLNSFVMMLNEVHAVAYVRESDEQWILCNDKQQRVLTKAQLHRELSVCGPEHRSIIVFYERIKDEEQEVTIRTS